MIKKTYVSSVNVVDFEIAERTYDNLILTETAKSSAFIIDGILMQLSIDKAFGKFEILDRLSGKSLLVDSFTNYHEIDFMTDDYISRDTENIPTPVKAYQKGKLKLGKIMNRLYSNDLSIVANSSNGFIKVAIGAYYSSFCGDNCSTQGVYEIGGVFDEKWQIVKDQKAELTYDINYLTAHSQYRDHRFKENYLVDKDNAIGYYSYVYGNFEQHYIRVLSLK